MSIHFSQSEHVHSVIVRTGKHDLDILVDRIIPEIRYDKQTKIYVTLQAGYPQVAHENLQW
jgi:hypothetical protein